MRTVPGDFYTRQRAKLLKGHDKMLRPGYSLLTKHYGDQASSIIRETHAEFDALIPKIPYIGGNENPLTDTLVKTTSVLALYNVLLRRGQTIEEIGALVHELARADLDANFPLMLRKLAGRLMMTRFWRARARRKAAISQQREYPFNFVTEVVEGNGEFEWGINYLECGIVKFFHEQGADEFTPYMCVIDFLVFPAVGINLHRTGTIASGCTHCDFRFKKGKPELVTP